MLNVVYLLVNTKTLMLVVDRTYEFTSGVIIPYLTYWTYSQMDFFSVKSHAIVQVQVFDA